MVGNNAFKLSIHAFLRLHQVFNVELLCPYYTLLQDISEVLEQLEPIEINLDCLEKDTIDMIMDK